MRKKQASKKAKENRTATAAAIIALTAAVIGAVFLGLGKDFWKASFGDPALRIGDITYSAAQCNYYFYSAYHAVLDSASGAEDLIGLDPSLPLDQQDCPLSEEGESWYEYLWNSAKEEMWRNTALYLDAESQGMTLSKEDQSEIANLEEYYMLQAADAGYDSADDYLSAVYGEGMTVELLKELMERQLLAQDYENQVELSYSFSEEELRKYYTEHSYEFSNYTYLYAYVGSGEDAEQTAQDLCEAESREAFEAAARAATGRDCYEMSEISGSELGDPSLSDIAWLTDAARQAGDTYAGQAGEDWFVLWFLQRSDNGFLTGEDEQWKTIASARLRSEKLGQWEDSLMEACPVEELDGAEAVGQDTVVYLTGSAADG